MADEPEQTTEAPAGDDPLRAALRLHEAGKPADAVPLYEKAIAAHPDTAQLHCLLGVALKQSGDLPGGIRQIEKATALDPSLPDLQAELGIAYMQAGAAEKAAQALGDAVPKLAALDKDDALVLTAYGDACFALKQWPEAITHYRAALAKLPDSLDVQLNIGVALHHLDRKAETIEAYEAVLAASPDHTGALTNLGVAYQEPKQFDASQNVLERAAELMPRDPLILTDLGTTLQQSGRLEDAIQRFTQALAEDPTYAKAWSNLGNAYQAGLNLTEAWEAHQRAVKLEPDNPDLHWNLAMTLLLAGEYEQGWDEYEWRRRRDGGGAGVHAVPEWRGEPLAGKSILLTVEQGAGDAIQFARYAPLLAADGAHVVLRVHTSLQRLLTTLSERIEILGPTDPAPDCDYQAPLLSLPCIRRDRIETLPAPKVYLDVPANIGNPLPPAEDGIRRVGLVWAGNPGHANDHNRSCPFDTLAPLFALEDVEWVSLQKEGAPDSPAPLIDLSGQLNDFADTAAAMRQLDLVISVDTAAAHLAGALGRPVWVLLPFAPDWRWLTERTDSPWYPTARLYRQPAPGDWASVTAAIAYDLK